MKPRATWLLVLLVLLAQAASAQLEDRLAHARVLRIRPLQAVLAQKGVAWEGSSPIALLDLEGGLQAVFRSEDEPWGSLAEAAAYRFDRWLGTGLVPCTVPRTLKRSPGLDWPWSQDTRPGSAQLYLAAVPATEAQAAALDPYAVSDMEALSFILGRYDNHLGNLLIDARGAPFLVDFENSLELQKARYGDFPYVRRGGRFSDPRGVPRSEPFPFEHPRQLVNPSREELHATFGPWWNQSWPQGMDDLFGRLKAYPDRIIPYAIWNDRLWVQARARSRHPAAATVFREATTTRLGALNEEVLKGLLGPPYGPEHIQLILERTALWLAAARLAP